MPGLPDTSKLPAVFKDPFGYDHIEMISFYSSRKWNDSGFEFWARVVFKNGQTKGEQHFNGTSFEHLAKQVHEFCESLRK